MRKPQAALIMVSRIRILHPSGVDIVRKRLHIIFSFLLAIPLLLSACTLNQGTASVPATEQPRTEAEETRAPSVESLATQSPASPEPAPDQTARPQPSAAAVPESQTIPQNRPDSCALKSQPRVSDEFFSDAAFFGNSLIGGLKLYGQLGYADFFGVTSAAVYNVETTLNSTLSDGTKATLLDALCEKQYGKIYVLLGINEMSFEPEFFTYLYNGILDRIAEREPDAELYIMSLTPVTREKSADESVFTRERVLAYNAALSALAERRGCYYVDLCDALADGEGYLPTDVSTDGIHLTKETYPVWAEYLRTHYAPSEKSAAFVVEAV